MYQQPDLYGAYPPEPGNGQAPHRRRKAMTAAAALVAVGSAIAFGVVYSGNHGATVSGSGSVAAQVPAMDRQGTPGGGTSGGGTSGGGTSGGGTSGGDGSGIPQTGSGTATDAQQVGVVDINTVLKYQSAAAAGTGLVLTSSGEILTNNHVVDGATSISVQVVSTGRTYTASVVGTDPSDDVAVLQLQNASGLQTANIGNSSGVQIGDEVTGVGNAGGRGGTPSAADGSVVALDQSLTASDGTGQNAERLTGMIETDAPIEAGDSGGPLYDSSDRVIGIDTAASDSSSGASVGFAIPINRATSIASEIEAGHASATIHIGYPGFLGIATAPSSDPAGALVQSALADGPAAGAGLEAGDVITAVDGSSVDSDTALRAVLTARNPGQRVVITWVDASGTSHDATVTLATGPAD